MVLARNKLTPYSLSFFCDRGPGLKWQGSKCFVHLRWKLGDSGVKPLGWNGCLCCKRKRCLLEYVFNKEREQNANLFLLEKVEFSIHKDFQPKHRL